MNRTRQPPSASRSVSATDWGEIFRRSADEWAAVPSHAKANELFAADRDAPHSVEGFRSLAVGVLRNATVEPWLPELYAALLGEGIRAKFHVGDYATYERYATAPQELCNPFPKILLLYFESATLVGDARHDPPPDTEEMVLARIGGIVEGLLGSTAATLVVSNLAPAPIRFHRLHADQDPGSWPQMRRRINAALLDRFRSEPRVIILNMDRLVGDYGAVRAFDPRMYLMVRNPFAVGFLPCLGRTFAGIVAAVECPPRKCVVVDCDNTLWGGVLGEAGPGRVAIGQEYPGEAYREFQQFLAGLRRRGFLLAISSKNNEEDVLSFLSGSAEMILRPNDFTAYRINWNDKGENLAELAAEMNIGLDSMIFVDDSPVECARIRSAFPEVQVEQFPANPAEIPDFIACMRGTERLRVEAEDLQRAESLRANVERQRLRHTAPDLKTFIRSLEIRLTIERQNRVAIPRISQLTQRTNQFNLTTRRYSPGDIERFLDDGVVYTMSMQDRFSDYGIVGTAIVANVSADIWEIDTFLLSCRAFGRGIESQMLATLLTDAATAGVEVVRARYLPTARNGMVRDFLPAHGFDLVERKNGELHFRIVPEAVAVRADQDLYHTVQKEALQ